MAWNSYLYYPFRFLIYTNGLNEGVFEDISFRCRGDAREYYVTHVI